MSDSPFEIHYSPGDELVIKVKSPIVSEFLPEEVRQHFWTARKEMLMSLRGMLDKAIEKVEEKAEAKSPKSRKKTKIEIE